MSTKRISANYVYVEGRLHRQAVIEIDSHNEFQIKPLNEEISNTEFYNGLIFVLKSDEDIVVIINRLIRNLQETPDIMQTFSKLNEENLASAPNYYILLEDIDLHKLKWLPESQIRQLRKLRTSDF